MKSLPIFRGYTVDVSLREFRKITESEMIWVPFDSPKGQWLYKAYLATCQPENLSLPSKVTCDLEPGLELVMLREENELLRELLNESLAELQRIAFMADTLSIATEQSLEEM